MSKKLFPNKLVYFSQILSFIVIAIFFITYEYNMAAKMIFSICIVLNLVSMIIIIKSKFKLFKSKSLNIFFFITTILFSLLMIITMILLYMLTDTSS